MTKKLTIKNAAVAVEASSYLHYRRYLKDLYVFMVENDSSYNYQKFAEDMGLTGTSLHQMVQGYRPVTTKTAEKFVKHLGLKTAQRRYFLSLIEYCNSKSGGDKEKHFAKMMKIKDATLASEIDRDLLTYFSEWYHPIVKELVGMKDFVEDPKWIASHTFPKIRPEQARKSIELLEKIGFIKRNESGKLEVAKDRVSTGHRVRGMGLTRFHQSMIELAKKSVTDTPGKERDVSSVTASVDEKTFLKIKNMIHDFQLQVLDEADQVNDPERVVQINVQLFPVSSTKLKGKK